MSQQIRSKRLAELGLFVDKRPECNLGVSQTIAFFLTLFYFPAMGIREWLYSRKEKDQAVRAPQLAREIKAQFAVEVEPGHLNYLLRKRGLTARPGHPPKPESGDQEREAGSAPGESLDNAPLFTADGTGQDGRPTGLSNSAHDRDRTKTFIQVQATHPEA